MIFRSSRDARHVAGLSDAIGRGLAPDGGLYVPEALPAFTPASFAVRDDLPSTADPAYLATVGSQLLAPFFAGDALEPALSDIARIALNFPAPLVPLRPLNGAAKVAAPVEVLELFHGPTAAFKDFGARFLSGCLRRRHEAATRPLTILVATSGDTGGAVAAAFHRQSWAEVFVLFPKGMVSPRQQQQLTCWDANVHSFAVQGNFDACQQMVKAAFLDAQIAAARDLSSANSINIGRLLPQAVYYAAASLEVQRRTGRAASFIVPSGNLGNVVACIWAREMGLPIDAIVLAHNANRTVPDYLESGHWEPRPSVHTLASAMDVGNPSNMERLRHLHPAVDALRGRVRAETVSDEQIRARIRADYATYGRIWCPHSATAAEAYARLPDAQRQSGHWVLVATAHPAKFSEIVEPIIGRAVEIPGSLAALLSLPAAYQELQPDLESFKGVLLPS